MTTPADYARRLMAAHRCVPQQMRYDDGPGRCVVTDPVCGRTWTLSGFGPARQFRITNPGRAAG